MLPYCLQNRIQDPVHSTEGPMWSGLSPFLASQCPSHGIHSGVLASFGTCYIRRWDGCMASLTQRTWVWVDSGSWWWTGRPGVLRFMGLQRVGHDWATELNWNFFYNFFCCNYITKEIYKLTKLKCKKKGSYLYEILFNVWGGWMCEEAAPKLSSNDLQ